MTMKFRKLGKTGLRVSELGFGTSHLNEIGNKDATSLLEHAIGLGINVIDTADIYGHGSAEEVIGNIRSDFNDIIIITKIGTNFYDKKDGHDLTRSYLDMAIDRSLSRLKRKTLDVLLLHSPPKSLKSFLEVLDFVTDMKLSQKINYWGISAITPSDFLPFESYLNELDIVEISYSFVYQEPASLFSLLQKHNIGIIAKEILHNGALLRRGTVQGFSNKRIHKLPQNLFDEIIDEIANFVGPTFDYKKILSYAIGFVLYDQRISTALLGTSSLKHLNEAINAYGIKTVGDRIYPLLKEWCR
jgi:aryl-alcohol dehydrogenase-like predicted oxidoreductase